MLLLRMKLYLAPLSTTATDFKVLDVCTGTGIWAIDLADEQPSWEVIGVDISPHMPSFVPPNLRFEVCDL